MTKTIKNFGVLFLIFISGNLFSQTFTDTIQMLNGSRILTSVIESNDSVTRCINPKKPSKTLLIDNDRIFSIKNTSGEKLIYYYDSIKGNDLTIDEMRYYIIGEQDAEKGYKPRGAIIGGILVGAGAGITGSFLAPVAPFAYTALLALPKIKIKKKTVSNPELLKQETYLMGYERVARKKRNLQSLIGGGAGLVAGLGAYGILKENGQEIIK